MNWQTQGIEQLIAAAKNGDSDAFGVIVEQLQDRLFCYVCRMVACQAEAEDVVQETFVKAYQRLQSFRGDSQFLTWLYRIAMNCVRTRFRRMRPVVPLDLEEECVELARPAEQESTVLGREESHRLERALQKLPLEERAVVLLRHLDGFDYQSISVALQIPIGTVRSRLYRARQRLRCRLKERET